MKRNLIRWLSVFYDARMSVNGNIQIRLRPRKQKFRRQLRTGEYAGHARLKALGIALMGLAWKVRITRKGKVHLLKT